MLQAFSHFFLFINSRTLGLLKKSPEQSYMNRALFFVNANQQIYLTSVTFCVAV